MALCSAAAFSSTPAGAISPYLLSTIHPYVLLKVRCPHSVVTLGMGLQPFRHETSCTYNLTCRHAFGDMNPSV